VDVILKLGQARVGLGGIWPEDFLVGNSGPVRLRQRLYHRPRVARVRNQGDTSGITIGEAPAGCIEVLRGASGCFELAKMADPGGKLRVPHLPLEAGELQMGMGVDQAGNQDGVAELVCRHTRRPRDYCIRTNGLDSAVGVKQNCTTLYRRGFDRQQPASREPPGSAVSVEWESDRLLP
jgi:hypothetical protein